MNLVGTGVACGSPGGSPSFSIQPVSQRRSTTTPILAELPRSTNVRSQSTHTVGVNGLSNRPLSLRTPSSLSLSEHARETSSRNTPACATSDSRHSFRWRTAHSSPSLGGAWPLDHCTIADVRAKLVERSEEAVANDASIITLGPQLSGSPVSEATPHFGNIRAPYDEPLEGQAEPNAPPRNLSSPSESCLHLTSVVQSDPAAPPILWRDGRIYELCCKLRQNGTGELYHAKTNEGQNVIVNVLRKPMLYGSNRGRENAFTAIKAMKRIREQNWYRRSPGGFLMPLFHSWSDDLNIYSVLVSSGL